MSRDLYDPKNRGLVFIIAGFGLIASFLALFTLGRWIAQLLAT